MMKILNKSFGVATIVAALFSAGLASAASITLTPAAQTASVNSLVDVEVVVSGLGNGVSPALGAYDLVFDFDPSILSLSSVSFSTRLGDPTDPTQTEVAPVNSVTPGAVEIDETSFLSAAQLFALQTSPDGSFTVAALTFNAIAGGTSTVTPVLPAGGLSDENGNDITSDFTVANATIAVGPSTSGAPEPASGAMLFAGSLLVFGAIRRKSK
jgi:hypothetical protein